MRETRPSGSEGGARSIPCPYPISRARQFNFGIRVYRNQRWLGGDGSAELLLRLAERQLGPTAKSLPSGSAPACPENQLMGRVMQRRRCAPIRAARPTLQPRAWRMPKGGVVLMGALASMPSGGRRKNGCRGTGFGRNRLDQIIHQRSDLLVRKRATVG